MSLNRIGAAQKVIASSRKVVFPTFQRFARLQSNSATTSGLKFLLYGVSTTGLVVGGSLVYGNYDPSFRYKVDGYIPGFAGVVDLAADKWVELVDKIKPRSSDKVGLNKDSVGFVSRPDTTKSETKKVALQTGNTDPPQSPKTKSRVSSSTDSTETYKKLKPLQNSDAEKEPRQVTQTLQLSVDEVSTNERVKDDPPPLSTSAVTDTTKIEGRRSGELSNEGVQKEEVVTEDNEAVASDSQLTSSLPSGDHETAGGTIEAPEAVGENIPAATPVVKSEQTSAEGLETRKVSEEDFQWLKDAAQAETLVNKIYDKYCELDKRTHDLCRVLIDAEKRRQEVFTQAMNGGTDDISLMQNLAEDIAKADEEVQVAERSLTTSQIETSEVGQELALLLDKALDLGLKSKVDEVRSGLSQLHARAMMSAVDHEEEKINSKVMEEYKHRMEKAKDQITSEMGTSLPPMESQQEAIILMLIERLKMLTLKVEELQEDYQSQLTIALLKQKEELEQLAEKKAQLRLQEQEREIWDEAQKKLSRAVQKREEELKEQLFIQTEAHSQHLSEALQSQAEQLEARWAKQVDAKLSEQESYYQIELVKAMARLHGIEAVIDNIANAGVKTHQQQSLRTACDSLCAALEQVDIKVDPYERYSFTNEVASLRKAARGDAFIVAVLDCIPKEAITKSGIQSEAGLQQRFRRVKQICKRVALVPEVGGGLGSYALSYLHSILAIDVWKHNSTAMLQKDPVDMDTFELLQSADNLLQQGSFEGATQVLNCLQGEPKRVARDWLRDAQLHLETKQAISVVKNYLATISLSVVQ